MSSVPAEIIRPMTAAIRRAVRPSPSVRPSGLGGSVPDGSGCSDVSMAVAMSDVVLAAMVTSPKLRRLEFDAGTTRAGAVRERRMNRLYGNNPDIVQGHR